MTLSPERNDVDISALFEYRKPITIRTKDGNLDVYMRVVGDSEVQRARVKALRASREMRNKLKNENSDEYLAFIPDLSEADKERLVEITLVSNLKEITGDVVKEVEVPFPKEPDSEASLEEQEEYQKSIDEYPSKRDKIIQGEILKRANKQKEELIKLSEEELRKEYIIAIKNEICEIELTKVFYDYIVFFSLYKDKEYTKSLFENFEQFEKLPIAIKEKLIEEYRSLELGLDELKK